MKSQIVMRRPMQTTWTLAWTSRFLDWLIRCLAAAAVQAKWCIQCSCVCVCVCVCRCVTVCGQWTYSPIICMSVDFCCVDCDDMLSVMTV